VAKGLTHPVSVAVERDGSLLVLERAAWVKDAAFKSETGWLTRLSGTSSGATPGVGAAPAWAKTLTAALPGSSVRPFKPQGMEAVEVRLAAWEPGVKVERFIRLPDGQKATIKEGDILWPPGTLLVRHVSAPADQRPLLTTLSWPRGPSATDTAPASIAYRWKLTGEEADLITETTVETAPGTPMIWPGPMQPHPAWPPVVPGYVDDLLPGNIVSPAPDVWCQGEAPRPLPHVIDTARPVADRARGALAVHCASCHRTGGVGRAFFDLRLSVPLAESKLIRGALMSGDQGVKGAQVIAPGQPDLSMLWLRLARPAGDPLRMPPGCLHQEAHPVAPLIKEWIAGMK
jgi:mono/diheme cytochrome c family protein